MKTKKTMEDFDYIICLGIVALLMYGARLVGQEEQTNPNFMYCYESFDNDSSLSISVIADKTTDGNNRGLIDIAREMKVRCADCDGKGRLDIISMEWDGIGDLRFNQVKKCINPKMQNWVTGIDEVDEWLYKEEYCS